jgi:diguanylate cyclase (GGDEF)-like protein
MVESPQPKAPLDVATRSLPRVALAIVAGLTPIAVLAATLGREPAIRVPSFLASFVGAIVVTELISSYVFAGYYQTRRDLRYLFLASAYACSGCLAVPYFLTFPGIFAPLGLFGATEQTALYLWLSWHAFFPLLILASAVTPPRMAIATERLALWSLAAYALAIGLAAVATLTLLRIGPALPVLVSGSTFTAVTRHVIAPCICALSALALTALLRSRKPYPAMTVWIVVSLTASCLDTAMGLLSARYSYGWYAGELFGVISSSIILAAYVFEMRQLQAKLSDETDELRLINESERRESQERLRYLAYHDHLTGLLNRTRWRDLFRFRIESHSGASDPSAAVFLVNLDGFRDVNDRLGEAFGDALLIQVSRRIEQTLGSQTVLGRLNGDEFAILAPAYESAQELDAMAHRILDAIMLPPYVVSEREIDLTGSIGLARFPEHGGTTEILLQHADIALCHAKQAGGNRLREYDARMSEEIERERKFRDALLRAVRRSDFVMHYQPLVDLKSGRMQGVEALVRWTDPDLGLIPPAEFIPVAEESGLMEAIGRWTIEAAVAQARVWNDLGCPLRMSINASVVQLQDHRFFDHLHGVLRLNDVAPAQIELEVTETAAIMNSKDITDVLSRCRARGISIALDDYGTHYSSLTYLRRLPIDTIKIDQSFVKEVPTSGSDSAIIRSVIALGHDLGKAIVAEGIETPDQLAWLRTTACDIGQGYLFARPMPPNEITPWKRKQTV